MIEELAIERERIGRGSQRARSVQRCYRSQLVLFSSGAKRRGGSWVAQTFAGRLCEGRASLNTERNGLRQAPGKFFWRMDVTEEFPFLVTKRSPY